jgi:hypothetical protein
MKKLFLAVAIFCATFSLQAQAANQYQELVLALQQAAIEKDDLKRLDLYDAIIRQFGIANSSAPSVSTIPTEPAKWLTNQEADPLTDKQTYYFILQADSGTNEWGKKPVLIIRSTDDDLELYINWNTYLGNDTDNYKNPGKYITVRIDSDQPTTALWGNSTDDKASFCPWNKVVDLVQRIGEGTKLVARCTPYGANPITAIFDIHGFKSISMPYNDVLGWWK